MYQSSTGNILYETERKDFNVDYLDRNQSNRNKFTKLFKKYGCKQLITDITRPGRHKSSCLDWIVTNSCFVSEACSLNILIADHFAVSSVRKKKRECVSYVYRDIRDYSNYNAEQFTDLLRTKLDLSVYMNLNDPNILWDLMINATGDILQVMCPIRRYKQREILTPWMVADIYREIRIRERILVVFRTRSNESLCALRRQRNIVNSKIETAKKNYIHKIMNENNKNPRKFWKVINELLNGKKTATEYPQFIDPVTKVHIPFGNEAHFLNSYFCNIIDRLDLDSNITLDEYRLIETDLNKMYGHTEK